MIPVPDATELFVDRVRVAGRRPIVSAVFVAVGLVSFIGLAILKPWVPSRNPSAAGPSTSPAPAVAAHSNPPTSAPLQPVAEATPLSFVPKPAELLGTTVRHDAWGIRAVVVPAVTDRYDVDGSVLAERWIPIDVAHGAAWNLVHGGAIENPGDTVLAIGATMPADVTQLGVRFWRLDGPSEPSEIAPVLVDPGHGVELWLPDPANSTAIGTWAPGTYRITVTVGDRVVHLVMIVRGDVSTG